MQSCDSACLLYKMYHKSEITNNIRLLTQQLHRTINMSTIYANAYTQTFF
jgi:hypothetical protein